VGDALDRLKELPDCSIDSVVCDPPYGLRELPTALVASVVGAWLAGDTAAVPAGKGFMGKSWDSFVPPPALWAECLRVLKPGGHLAAFAGSRTVDLMGLSIRLAGFESRDEILWVYSQGFPKSGLLKPAHEPIVLARKPFKGSRKACVLEHGTGGLNIDACRVGTTDRFGGGAAGSSGFVDGYAAGDGFTVGSDAGRWPANLVLTHDATCQQLTAGSSHSTPAEEVSGGIWAPSTGKPAGPTYTDQPARWDCVAGCPVAVLDQQSGTRPGSNYPAAGGQAVATAFASGQLTKGGPRKMGDSGGASRFFTQAGWEPDLDGDAGFLYTPKPGKKERNAGVPADAVKHCTIKPVAVVSWLQVLLTPPGGTTLDPFMGSGTSGVAAVRGGFRFIGCELTADYLPTIEGRIGHAEAEALAAPLTLPLGA